MATSSTQRDRTKLIWNGLSQLRSIGPKSNAPVKFILDKSPFVGVDDDDDSSPPNLTGEAIILGRLLPNKSPFDQCSLPVKFTLPPTYPMVAPKIYMLKDTYHPNVAKDGKNKSTDSMNTTTQSRFVCHFSV